MKFIKLTEHGSGVPIWINPAAIMSIFHPQGVDRTTLKGMSLHEHVRETPEEIMALIG
jgi:hypothetical protein